MLYAFVSVHALTLELVHWYCMVVQVLVHALVRYKHSFLRSDSSTGTLLVVVLDLVPVHVLVLVHPLLLVLEIYFY